MDVISMAENDVKLAVASMGTTLSKNQINQMWNLVMIFHLYVLMVMRQEENPQKLLLKKF